MKTVALLTGRGNNTLKDKNVIDILGHPVIYYPAHAAKKASKIDDFYCSSDDDKILNAAAEEGFKKIVRPLELALPTSQHIDCILHAIEELKKDGVYPDVIVVILANNVTIKSSWIDDCIQKIEDDDTISSVVPVYIDNDHHPLRAKKADENGFLQMYEDHIEGKVSTNRQDLPSCYFLSHNFWVLNMKNFEDLDNGQQPWSFMGNKIAPYIIDESIDIHDIMDLEIAKNWIEKNYTD